MKISIVVPVYNVSAYLSTCLDSLLDQGMAEDDYEIIVIDDGSPDNSGQIADAYAAKHQAIRVIHQANRGLSGARNVGIAAAKGEYLWFVDSDDLIAPQMLPRLLALMDEHQLDKLMFHFIKFMDSEADTLLPKVKADNGKIGLDQLTVFEDAYQLSLSLPPDWRIVCNFILRTDVLRRSPLRFVERILFEDKEFNFWLDRIAGRSAIIPWHVYFYRNNSSGIVHTAMSDKLFPSYVAGRIKLAALKKSQIDQLDQGTLLPLRTPVTHDELVLRYIHEVQGILKNLFEKGDKAAFNDALKQLKEKQLYPYPIRLASLKLPGQGMGAKLLAFLFPVEGYLRLCFAAFSLLKHR